MDILLSSFPVDKNEDNSSYLNNKKKIRNKKPIISSKLKALSRPEGFIHYWKPALMAKS